MQQNIFKIILILYSLLASNFAYADIQLQEKFKDIPNIRIFEKPLNGNKFTITDIKGKVHELSEFQNKPIILALWAIWCVPCRHEIPELAKIKSDIPIIALNVDNSSDAKILDFIKSVKAENLSIYRDKAGELFSTLQRKSLIFGLPTVLLFNKEHNLIASINGFFDWNSQAAKNLLTTLTKL